MRISDRLFKIISFILSFMIFASGSINIYAKENNNTFPSKVKYENIGKEIEDFVKENDDELKAMSVCVFDRENIIYQNYFGNTADNIKNDKNKVFEWGSISKLLVWVSVMQLWEEGKIDLNEDIKTYLPKDFLINLNFNKKITMINLMNHNAGFQETYTDIFLKDDNHILPLGEQLKKHEPEQIYSPGNISSYSNWSTALAGYIVERVSGVSYDKYVKKNIFDKLNMKHTAISVDLSDNNWVKERREKLECFDVNGESMGNGFYHITLYPAGMCTGTIEDLTKFAMSLNKENYVLFKNKNTLKKMFTPTSYLGDSNIPQNYHGFWNVNFKVPTIGHGGNSAGCSSYLLIEPKSGVGMTVMTNRQNEDVFNHKMPELLFGKFKNSPYYKYEKELKSNFYKDARGIYQGPMKISSIGFYTLDNDTYDDIFAYGNKQGIDKVSFEYGDYIKMEASEVAIMLLILIFMLISIGYSLITTGIGGLIIRPIKKRKEKYKSSPLTKWHYISCIAIVLWGMVMVGIVKAVSSYMYSGNYTFLFVLCFILLLSYIFLLIRFFIKRKDLNAIQSIKEKVKYYMTAICLLFAIFSMFYFEMYKFWAL